MSGGLNCRSALLALGASRIAIAWQVLVSSLAA